MYFFVMLCMLCMLCMFCMVCMVCYGMVWYVCMYMCIYIQAHSWIYVCWFAHPVAPVRQKCCADRCCHFPSLRLDDFCWAHLGGSRRFLIYRSTADVQGQVNDIWVSMYIHLLCVYIYVIVYTWIISYILCIYIHILYIILLIYIVNI